MTDLIDIDGSLGEGGGQVLRSALALSLVTGRPLRIHHLRSGRPKPGLRRQHLAALRAAEEVGEGAVTGATLGSQEVTFRPRVLRGGDFRFDVGAAGSATLVFQTVLPALLQAPQASRLVLDGGTHNPWAPPFDFLERAFLPLLARMGAHVGVRLERRGYYPRGGGRFTAEVQPVRAWIPLDLPSRGAIRARRALVLLARLPATIAAREEAVLRRRLAETLWSFRREAEPEALGPGNAVLLEVEAEHVTEVFTAFGRREVRAEALAEGVVDEMERWLAADVPVGPHLADQLLLPMAIGAGGAFRTLAPTAHTITNAAVIGRFLPARAPVVEGSGATAVVRVGLGPEDA